MIRSRYDIVNEFPLQKSQQSPRDFTLFLMNHLIHTVGLSAREAERDARAMLAEKRLVEEGDYAYVLDDDHNYVYFVQ